MKNSKRLTVHLKRVSKVRNAEGGGKSKIYNTLSFRVKDQQEADLIVSEINDTHPKNNVSKSYLSNIN